MPDIVGHLTTKVAGFDKMEVGSTLQIPFLVNSFGKKDKLFRNLPYCQTNFWYHDNLHTCS